MHKSVNDGTIYFYDDMNNEIMYIKFLGADCVWYFKTAKKIKITKDMELYSLLNNFMNNRYIFGHSQLQDYKDETKLIWYSDGFYDPHDAWSVASISCLKIEKNENCFNIRCTKKLDEIIDRPSKTYGICFSPAGNGKYSQNVNAGSTLQDDFITQIYQPLLNKNMGLKKTRLK